MQPLKGATSANVHVRFSLIGLNVSVHAAVGEDDSRGLKTTCPGRTDLTTGKKVEHPLTAIKQRWECPTCGNDHVSEFVKAKPVGDGFVPVPEDVIGADKEYAATFKKSIELTAHPAADVSAQLLPSGKSYYLNLPKPTVAELQTYSLLVELILSRPDLAFMSKFTLSSAVSLFQLTVAGERTLLLRQMADAALVREHPRVEHIAPDAELLNLAKNLADQQTTPFLVAEHGTGKSSIIPDYVAAQTPQTAGVVAATDTPAGGMILDLKAALAAALTAKDAPKKAAPKKRAVRKAS